MIQTTTIKEVRKELRLMRKKGFSVGFVPTMGALHEGHLSLIRQSNAENDITVCSIFVNPIQFNNPSDLENYPRMAGQDIKLLEKEGCHLAFIPDAREIYPDNEKQEVIPDFGLLDKVMEGKFRPGHFRGVAIVVKKLFGIVEPDRAYFGKKDYQQLAIIKKLTELLNLPLSIVSCETVREPDGLAMSSRNLRLTIGERGIAPHIYEVLCKSKQKVGKIPVWELKEWATKKIQEKSEFKVEYFEIADRDTLMPLDNWDLKDQAVALTAVYLGDIRLIDNIELFS